MNRRSHLQILGPVDTAFYYVDRPETPMNIGAVCTFEGKIPFDQFIKLVEARIFRAPLYQQRVIQAPLHLGQPSWVLDPDFYVGNHVFHVELPAPGTEEQLREFAGHLISGMLDRSKPLWELYLIDGLEGDRTAMLLKVHHCMVDGLAAVELFTMLMDFTPEVPPEPRHPVYDPPYLPNPTELVTRAIRSDLPHRWNVLKKIGGDVGRLGGVLTDKEKRRQTFVGVANLINDNLSRIKSLPINGENSGKTTVAWAEFPLAEVKAIRAVEEASINEVLLSVLGGGLHGYLQSHAYRGKQDFLRVIVPVTMRQEEEKDDFGNRISVVPIDVPFNVSDPLERLRKVRDYSQVMKHSSLTIGLDLVLSLPSLYPSFTQPIIWGAAPTAFALLGHSWCTNVAGPPIPVYVLGHQMQHAYGYFPLNPTMGLACVILSYNERISMTLIADNAIIPDVTDLRDHLQNAYTALRRAARVAEMPLSTPAPKPAAPPPPTASVASTPQTPVASIPTAPVASTPPTPVNPVVAVQTVEPMTRSAEPESPAAPPETTSEAPASPVAEAAAEAPTTEPVPVLAVEPAPQAVVETPAQPAQPASEPAATDSEPAATDSESAASAQPVTAPPEPAPTPAAESAESVIPAPAAPTEPDPQPETPVLEAVASVASVAVSAPALNGTAMEREITPPAAAPVYTNGSAAQPPKLFSEAWAAAYQQAINSNPAYRAASLRWDAGQLAFIIHESPRHGFVTPAAVLLDLYRGECRGAHSTSQAAATSKASFIIEGDYDCWIKVLRGEADPVKMLMRGGLKLSKGSMLKLLPFTQSAQELVRSAQSVL